MARSTRRHQSPQASAEANESPINTRAASSASFNALSATTSDTESGEKPVREKLKKTTIAGSRDILPTSDHPMGDTLSQGKENEDDVPGREDDNQSSSDSDRGRLRRKRSFEDFNGDHGDDKHPEKPERHTRKKSRDIKTGQPGSESGVRMASGEDSVSKIDEHDGDEQMKSTESNSQEAGHGDASKVDDSALSQEMDTKEPATPPPESEGTAKEEGMVISPKNKRSRDEFLQGQDKETSALAEDDGELPEADGNGSAKSSENTKGAAGEERNPKRHRDSDSPKPSSEEENKTTQTKIPPSSGFANFSAESPFKSLAGSSSSSVFAPLAGSNSPSAQPQTSSSAFRASGFGAFASAASPLGGLSGSGSSSSFGAQAASSKPVSSGFGSISKSSTSSTSSGSGFAALASPGKSVFGGSASNSTFGGGSSSGFGSGFGGLVKPAMSSFAAPGGSGITGLSDKPAKPFGAADDEEDEDGSGGDSDEEGDGRPQQTEEVKKDKRFYEQEVETGEEDEETLFTARAKLYTYATTGDKKEWKERGTGNLKLNGRKRTLESEEGGQRPRKARFILRADGSHRLVLNSPIQKDLKFGDPKGEKPVNGFMYFLGHAGDDAKGAGVESMLLKMKPINAEELYKQVIELQKEM